MRRRLHNLTAPLRGGDPALLGAVGALLFIGLFVVWGAGSFGRLAGSTVLGQHYVAAKHLFMIAVGSVLALALMTTLRRARMGGLATPPPPGPPLHRSYRRHVRPCAPDECPHSSCA